MRFSTGTPRKCLTLTAISTKGSNVAQRLEARKEEICTSRERSEGWQAGYFSADRPFGDSEVESTFGGGVIYHTATSRSGSGGRHGRLVARPGKNRHLRCGRARGVSGQHKLLRSITARAPKAPSQCNVFAMHE